MQFNLWRLFRSDKPAVYIKYLYIAVVFLWFPQDVVTVLFVCEPSVVFDLVYCLHVGV